MNTLVNFRPAQPSKTGQFSTGVNTTKPLTPAQARINSLQQNAERAKDAVKRERDLQKQQKARDKLQRLQRPASIKT